jgi:antitoxin MazE
METVIKKWGNSAAVRIPSKVFEAAKLSLDQAVDVIVENGCVVLKPIVNHHYDLDALLEGITPENRQDEIDSGSPVGREVW